MSLLTRTIEDRVFAGSLPLGDSRSGYGMDTILENYTAVYIQHGLDSNDTDALLVDMLTDATFALVDETRTDDNAEAVIDPATLDVSDLDELIEKVTTYAQENNISDRSEEDYRVLAFCHCEEEQEIEFEETSD